ncbi:MAG TPA: PilN domain-containing protein [bacterium]
MIRINLLPRERLRAPTPAPLRVGVVVAVLLVAAAIVATLGLNARNTAVREEITTINAAITELEPKVARVEELKKLIEAAERKEQMLKRLEAARIPWDQVLLELRVIIPRDVWLTSVSAAQDGNLVFNGFGLTYTAIARFMVNLESSQMFEGTDLVSSQKQAIGTRPTVTFSVTSRLTSKRTEASSR